MKIKHLLSVFLAVGFALGVGSGPLAQSAQASSLKLCGQVNAYVKPTLLATGLLTINDVPLVVGVGVALPASVAVGADLCADLTTDAFGLVTGATITANAHVDVRVCGRINAYAAATATATGLLKVGETTFTIGLGAKLPASVTVGANLCLALKLDGFGRVSDGTVTVNATAAVKICGQVTAFSTASASSTGSLGIAGRTLVVAIGASLPASVHAGADLCLDLVLNGFGQVSGGTAVLDVTTTLDVCGQVTAYVAATANADGSLAVNHTARAVAAGTVLDARIAAAAFVKLRLVIDVFGRISDSIVLKVGASLDDACAVTLPGATPDLTPFPGTTPGPGPTALPGQSPAPTPGPGASPSAGPGGASSATPGPGGGGSGADTEPADQCGNGATKNRATDTTTLLPDTAEIGRAGEVVVGNAIPLVALGLLGGLAGWYRSRRRGLEVDELASAVAGTSAHDDADVAESGDPATRLGGEAQS
jgi:hypothetical protein